MTYEKRTRPTRYFRRRYFQWVFVGGKWLLGLVITTKRTRFGKGVFVKVEDQDGEREEWVGPGNSKRL